MTPLQIPGYNVKHLIGQGGMATVYLAEQVALGRDVAIKVMAPALAADATFTSRFLQEGATAANLFHPHIIKVFDTGVHENLYYLVMEYLSGGTLGDKIAAGLSVPEAIHILKNVTDALRYAHTHGVIHRDIKSQNILLYDDGTPVLSDLGVAKAISGNAALTQSGMIVGSPGYMSPEQFRGESLDARTDIYALGVLFFEMLTGQLPYQATDQFAVALKHINDPIPRLPLHLSVFQSLIDRVMAKQREARPADTTELLALIEQAEARYKATVSDETHKFDSREFKRHNAKKRLSAQRKISLVATLFIMIAAGTWGYFTWLDDKSNTPAKPLAEAAQTLLSEAERYQQENDYERSLEYIARALIIAPRSEQIMALQKKVLTQQAELHQRHARAANLLAQARQAQSDKAWSRGLNLTAKGLELAPNNAELLSLQAELETAQAEAERQAALERQQQEAQRRLAQQVQQLLSKAAELRAQGKLEASLDTLEQGLSLAPQNSALQTSHAEVSEQLAEQQRQQQQVTALLAQAQQAQAQGELEKALVAIEQGLELLPKHAQLLALRQTLEQQQATQQIQQQAQQLLTQAERLGQAGQYQQALQRITQALALPPAESENAALLNLQAKLEIAQAEAQRQVELERQRREQQQRLAQQVQQILSEASAFRDQKAFNQSLAKLEEGFDLAPENAALKALHAEVSEELAEQQRLAALERQRQGELERQRQAELERERLAELERQRQKELERERQRQAELERERQAELERERQAELERERQAELERERLAELERERLAELERERLAELERERLAELERERLAKLERERLAKLERQRQEELERERLAELERQQQAQQQAELAERQRQQEEINLLLARAEDLLQQGELAQSTELIQQGLALAPNNTDLQAARDRITTAQQKLLQQLTEIHELAEQDKLSEGLQRIEQALAAFPAAPELIQLQRQLQEQQQRQQLSRARLQQEPQPQASDLREQQVQELLASATAQLEQKRLTTPEGDNALETYRAVLALEQDNQQAQQGLLKIVAMYLQWAIKHKQQGNYRKSLMYIRRGLDVVPEHAELLSLRPQVETLEYERAEAKKRATAARRAAAARDRARREAEQADQMVITRPPPQPSIPIQQTPTIVRTTPTIQPQPVPTTPVARPRTPAPTITNPPIAREQPVLPQKEETQKKRIFSTF